MSGQEAEAASLAGRLADLSWPAIEAALDAEGWATLGPVLTPDECSALAALYDDSGRFRSRIVMARHGFGQGEYQYFAYPLPEAVQVLREALYGRLAPVANRWRSVLGQTGTFPPTLGEFTAECAAAGQTRPTPLLLKYGPGDYNRLHQDVYGERLFPFQVVFLLSEPGRDFSGGEFVLVEQKPRSQSRATVVPLSLGHAVIFAVHHRPARGTSGIYKAALRHGVSTVRDGARFTLGVIFHDAA